MGARSVLLAGADERDLTKLSEYRAIGGYDQVPKARKLKPEKLIETLLAANLRGRGGAGFPMGRKASLIDRGSSKPKYLVVNADESEPGAFKDREVMARVPHRLLEGCLIAAHAIECEHVFIYIRGEYLHEYEILERAVAEAREAGLLGDVEITVYRGAGAYICGEETALLDSLEGRRGQPRPRPPFPPVQGLFNAPTQINNVCTIATVPSIIELGPAEFAKIGVRELAGNGDLLDLRERREARQLRARARDADAGADLRLRRRDRRRARAEGRDPGRIVRAGALARPDRRAARLRLAGRARHVLRGRLADRRRRPLLHGAARPAVDEVLHARVVREVHALPRGHALDGADPREARGRPRARTRRSTCCARSARASSASRCARSATSRCTRSRATSRSGARSSRPMSSSAAARSTASRASRGSSLRATAIRRANRSWRVMAENVTPENVTLKNVTLKIDGREVSVPKGTGLVEAALAAGVEIPVFCYEPRLGPPVGACRMCLCEVAPGPPKPQAACTLTAADGMEVKTAATSEMAAEAQNATLEFILVNHPLDCPVCDKGGECPLQDLTFRYGPGNTRMTFPKRTFEKPIPISPTIALDRERCILCYRCTRFSEGVSEDGQLVAVERGAGVDDRDLRGRALPRAVLGERHRALPGRRPHLDPVPLRGAPVGDPERPDRLRPLPGRLQRQRHRPRRARSSGSSRATIPRSTRAGSATRAASRSRISARATASRIRCGATATATSSRSTGTSALDLAEQMLTARGTAIVTALSGSETVEQAYGLGRLLRAGLGAHEAVLPEEIPDELDAFRAPLSSIRDAPGGRRALRRARRRARSGRRPLDQGRPQERRADPLRAARRADRGRRPDLRRRAVHGMARPRPRRAAAFYLPRTPNGRGVADAWSAAGDGEPVDVEPSPRGDLGRRGGSRPRRPGDRRAARRP